MPRVLYALLLSLPIAVLARLLSLPDTVVFAVSVHEQGIVQQLSQFVAVILLLIYLAYLAYTLLRVDEPEDEPPKPGEPGGAIEAAEVWSKRRSLLVLGAATVGAAVSSE